jgi:hypothetical protein
MADSTIGPLGGFPHFLVSPGFLYGSASPPAGRAQLFAPPRADAGRGALEWHGPAAAVLRARPAATLAPALETAVDTATTLQAEPANVTARARKVALAAGDGAV